MQNDREVGFNLRQNCTTQSEMRPLDSKFSTPGEGGAKAPAWVGLLSSVMEFSNAQLTFARLKRFLQLGGGGVLTADFPVQPGFSK